MFFAEMLICSLLQGAVPPCVTLEDTRGPYKTEKECLARVEEMGELIPTIFNPPYETKYRCKQEGTST